LPARTGPGRPRRFCDRCGSSSARSRRWRRSTRRGGSRRGIGGSRRRSSSSLRAAGRGGGSRSGRWGRSRASAAGRKFGSEYGRTHAPIPTPPSCHLHAISPRIRPNRKPRDSGGCRCANPHGSWGFGLPRHRPSPRVQRLSRPVTPEVAGSSPIAPLQNSCKSATFCCLARHASREFAQQTGASVRRMRPTPGSVRGVV
jgi:hypothetical protein